MEYIANGTAMTKKITTKMYIANGTLTSKKQTKQQKVHCTWNVYDQKTTTKVRKQLLYIYQTSNALFKVSFPKINYAQG